MNVLPRFTEGPARQDSTKRAGLGPRYVLSAQYLEGERYSSPSHPCPSVFICGFVASIAAVSQGIESLPRAVRGSLRGLELSSQQVGASSQEVEGSYLATRLNHFRKEVEASNHDLGARMGLIGWCAATILMLRKLPLHPGPHRLGSCSTPGSHVACSCGCLSAWETRLL